MPILLFLTGPSLDALTLGEAAARSLGVRLGRLQALIVLGTGLTIGASVAVTGVVGFVGLVVPHMLRPIFGHRPSVLLLPSALGGAALVLDRRQPVPPRSRRGRGQARRGDGADRRALLPDAPAQGPHVMELIVQGLGVSLSGRGVLDGVSAVLRPGPGHRDPRPQWRGQVHPDQDAPPR